MGGGAGGGSGFGGSGDLAAGVTPTGRTTTVRVEAVGMRFVPASVTVPAGPQPGAVFTLKGHGLPRLDGRGRGALVVVLQVDVPTELTDRARSLLEQLDAELAASAG